MEMSPEARRLFEGTFARLFDGEERERLRGLAEGFAVADFRRVVMAEDLERALRVPDGDGGE